MKIIGSGLIEKDGTFLLVKAKRGLPKGLWNNPGGHKEEEESMEDTVKRELKEETGFDVEIGRLIGTYLFGEIKKSVYEAKIVGGILDCPPDEIEEARWFTIDEVKKLPNTTFGALQSILDYSIHKYKQSYQTEKIP